MHFWQAFDITEQMITESQLKFSLKTLKHHFNWERPSAPPPPGYALDRPLVCQFVLHLPSGYQ